MHLLYQKIVELNQNIVIDNEELRLIYQTEDVQKI